MRPRGSRPAALARALLASALLFCISAPAAGEEISLKTENYLFAASEALADGDPALALSLLKRAKAEDPGCCIVDEYLCRTYTQLGQLDRATESYSDFVGCMESSDEPVRQELEEALAEARRNQPAPDEDDAGVADAPAGGPAPRTGASGGGHPGLVIMGIGGAMAAGFGITATVTHVQSQTWIEDGDQELYEARKPLNNASVVLSAAGGGVAVIGLIIEIATASKRAEAKAAADLTRTPVMGAGPGQLGLSASWRF